MSRKSWFSSVAHWPCGELAVEYLELTLAIEARAEAADGPIPYPAPGGGSPTLALDALPLTDECDEETPADPDPTDESETRL